MTPRSRIHSARIPAAIAFLYVSITLAAAFSGYRWGYARWFSGDHAKTTQSQNLDPERQGITPKPSPYKVQGRSMAPTLVDGQVCWIETAATSFRIGDVVAVEWDSVSHVKRVAAVEGDTVDVTAGRLTINNNRLEELIAVRQSADNQSPAFLLPGLITLPQQTITWKEHAENSDWQVMQYQNPHQSGRITRVVDDYPENVDVKRRLNPVDRLVVQIAPIENSLVTNENNNQGRQNDSAKELTIAFHLDETTVVTQTRAGYASASDAMQQGLASQTLGRPSIELSPRGPLAINASSKILETHSIQVSRQIEYRDDHRPLIMDYPITLGKGELFLVGDNVPVSVDSRSIGPVGVDRVIGRVIGRVLQNPTQFDN